MAISNLTWEDAMMHQERKDRDGLEIKIAIDTSEIDKAIKKLSDYIHCLKGLTEWERSAIRMENRQFKEYSNAAQIDAAKIPQSTINILADIFFSIFMEAENDEEDISGLA